MAMYAPQRAPASPLSRRQQIPLPGRADLIHLALAAWLLIKQRRALALMGIPPGPDMMLASAGALLVLTAWVRRAAGRRQAVLWTLLTILTTLVLYADILYYRQFGDLVSIASLRYSSQLGEVSASVADLIQPGDLWFWADVPLVATLLLLPGATCARWFAPARWRFIALTVLVGAGAVGMVAATDPLLGERYFGHTMVGSRMGLLNYHAYDISSYLRRLTARLGPKAAAAREVREWFAAKRQSEGPADRSPLSGVARGKNVIVLQVESLQAFPLGMKVNGQEITPNLNRLMQESITFTNFFHQTGQGVTADADLLANCSLYPTRTGAVYYDCADNRFRCLPTLLREHGYTAVAMQGMPPDFWNLAAVYPQVGFERYDSIRAFDYDEKVGIGLSDYSFLRQAVAKLKALPEPYYAFLVTLTSHHPFDFDNLPRTLDLGRLEGTKAGWYLHAIHYTDGAIGRFVDQLRAEGVLDDAVLVVYGDHQGVWRSDEGMMQLLPIPADDEVGWVRVEKRVPLLIRLPGGAAAGEQHEAAGQADIAPTIAGLLGVPTESVYFMGRDLFATDAGVVPFYRGSAVDDAHLFLSPDDSGESDGACYAIATGERLEIGRCASLREDAARRLAISRQIVERDLIPALRAPR